MYIMVSNCELWRKFAVYDCLVYKCVLAIRKRFLGRPLQNNGSPYVTGPLSVLSVCNVGALQPNGWMDQGATWYGGRPRPRRHCVRWRPSSPTKRSTAAPTLLDPCILWANGRPSQQLLSSCLTKRRWSAPEIMQIDSGFLTFLGSQAPWPPFLGHPVSVHSPVQRKWWPWWWHFSGSALWRALHLRSPANRQMSGRRREMYCGHARLCVCVYVCLSVCPPPHAHTIAWTRM